MIKYIASIFIAAAILIAPGVSFSNDAVAANKWLRKAPTDNVANVADLTATATKVSRNQTVHFVVYEPAVADNTTGQVVVEGALAACDIDNAGGCASAPLFIQSSTAKICAVSETGDAAASGAVVRVYACPSEDLCTDNRSVGGMSIIGASVSDDCIEAFTGIGGDTNYDLPNVGGSWIYVDVPTLGTTNGDTTHVWVTGTD